MARRSSGVTIFWRRLIAGFLSFRSGLSSMYPSSTPQFMARLTQVIAAAWLLCPRAGPPSSG